MAIEEIILEKLKNDTAIAHERSRELIEKANKVQDELSITNDYKVYIDVPGGKKEFVSMTKILEEYEQLIQENEELIKKYQKRLSQYEIK